MSDRCTLQGIATREKSRVDMVEHAEIEVTIENGLVGDFRGKPGKRQVTVLATEAWSSACGVVGKELPWTTRRANLLVDRLSAIDESAIGNVIQIGDVRLKITGETDPCRRMDEYCPGLKEALTPNWRGGVCCRVLAGGKIAVGDKVQVIASN